MYAALTFLERCLGAFLSLVQRRNTLVDEGNGELLIVLFEESLLAAKCTRPEVGIAEASVDGVAHIPGEAAQSTSYKVIHGKGTGESGQGEGARAEQLQTVFLIEKR